MCSAWFSRVLGCECCRTATLHPRISCFLGGEKNVPPTWSEVQPEKQATAHEKSYSQDIKKHREPIHQSQSIPVSRFITTTTGCLSSNSNCLSRGPGSNVFHAPSVLVSWSAIHNSRTPQNRESSATW